MENDIKKMNSQNIIKADSYYTDIRESINKKFVGQEDVCNKLFDIIARHKLEVESNSFSYFGSKAVILDGATGTGKTAMVKEITQKLDIPCINWEINYGISINFNEILSYLYKIAKGYLEKAECGIVVLDNFETVLYNSNNLNKTETVLYNPNNLNKTETILYNPNNLNKIKKEDLQLEILRFLTGGKYKVLVEDSSHKIDEIEFDTSRLMFIYNSDLLRIKNSKGNINESLNFDERKVSFDDFEEMGLIRPLKSRISPNDILYTKKYSKEDLINILTKSTISPMLNFETRIKSLGKNLVVEDGVYERIASIALEMGNGARALEFLINKIARYMLFNDSLFFNKKEINLNLDVLDEIYKKNISRRI